MKRTSKNKIRREKLRKQALRKRLKHNKAVQRSKDLTVKKDYFRLKGKKAESILHELAPKQASSLRLPCSGVDDFTWTQLSCSSRLAG